MVDILGSFWSSAMLVIAVGLVLLLIGIYNSLVRLRQNVRQGVADIDAQLRQRHDLIPNLVETVQGYAGHEAGTLQAVIAARSAASRGDPSSGSEQQLRVALDNLLALGEAYPDLKASANFQSLQNELGDVEDKLAAARRALNAAVARFNSAREAFPAVLFAGLLGFGEADFHRLDDSEKGTVDQVPRIAF
ncbi:LemA family protein [Erythrobacter sanguineus]|jgi:LemA protein|uniref:LemA protein n=1 Tax=Erythrobacter sanguineus TaxID=198312 RepID=A0A1M7RTQ0_9SPHN|nr:LemA family protein [Erythrobacter sanguineus]MCR9181237.1 LemA family protein [Erythrobacteraceae bacterium]SHN49717.1 LemA protein [Erythrobacter sanguineus]